MSDTTDQAPATEPAPTITARVCAVMGDLGPVAKGGHNAHGGYRHSTVDDVYHAVRPLLARHGLDLRCTIVSREIVKYPRQGKDDGVRLDYRAELRFEAADGTAEPADTRYLSLPYTGPQTDEIAMSYLGKQYLRSRLKIETGDFEDETPLGAGAGGNGAAESTAWRNTPGARKIQARIDAALGQLPPSKVPVIQLAAEAARSIVELVSVAKRAEATVAAEQRRNGNGEKAERQFARELDEAAPPADPAPFIGEEVVGRLRAAAAGQRAEERRDAAPPADPAPGDPPPADPPPEPATGPTSDGYFEGSTYLIGESPEGDPEWGAIINAAPMAVLPGARVKVAMRSRPGRQRCIVTEVLDRVDGADGVGVVCRTRRETAADVAAAEAVEADGGEA